MRGNSVGVGWCFERDVLEVREDVLEVQEDSDVQMYERMRQRYNTCLLHHGTHSENGASERWAPQKV
jgi:hypothetical protein